MEVSKAAWFVYLVRCRDATLYCGIAKNLKKRLAEHNSPDKGAKYTRGRQPVQLVYAEEVSSRAEATQREGRIKRLSRTEKMTLIKTFIAGLKK
ncbi:MAG: GIY-YIG nuclease family protein [Desulfobulbaceae bacterium]|nr:GIY-YIG nuclease family protein [Desulfobulbaceae bacterium]HIJ89960.1 GIY-YIG nuclease family protein [Deltaproteobacteria bacterium]